LVFAIIYTPLAPFFQTLAPSVEMWKDIGGLFIITTVVGISLDYCIDRLVAKRV
jgi:hypothetical protein